MSQDNIHSTLFIGNFLSSSRKSMGPIEEVFNRLKREGFEVEACSNKESKILRLLDILFTCIISDSKIYHIDIFSGQALYFAFIAIKIGKLKRKTIVSNFHGGRLDEVYKKGSSKLNYVINNSDLILSPSLYLKDFFKQEGIKIKYLPNSVDLDEFKFKPQNIDENNMRILWVRAFTEIYNPLTAIKAIKLLKQNYKNIKLTMVGPDLGLMKDCKKLIKQLELSEAIEITGPVDHDKLPEYFNNSHIFWNTTSYESFGLALFEAAGSGTRIITNAVGEISYTWKNRENALFVIENSPEEFAERTIELIQNKNLRDRIVENAKRKVDEFSWEKIRETWIEILN
ncbi:MAG: glycosyltransferase family 4 protein [Cytophagales bacterium]